MALVHPIQNTNPTKILYNMTTLHDGRHPQSGAFGREIWQENPWHRRKCEQQAGITAVCIVVRVTSGSGRATGR